MKPLDAAALHEVPQSTVDKIAKMLQLADRAGSPAEAAAALAKAQEFMARHNLQAETVRALAGPGAQNAMPEEKREKTKVDNLSIMYKWQRSFWQELAVLNFCWFFGRSLYEDHPTRKHPNGTPVRRYVQRPVLLGRESNVLAATVMGRYVHEAIERLCPYTGPQRLCGDAITWREGFAAIVVERLLKQRADQEKTMAAEPGASTALTLRSVAEREDIANYDAYYGAGAWQRKLDREAEAERERKAEEERRAALTPEQRLTEDRAAQEARHEGRGRARRASYRYNAGPRERYRSGTAYREGAAAGAKLGLDRQASSGVGVKEIE